MTGRHVVQEAVFDFSFRGHALMPETELAAFVQTRLLPVVEEVFDQVSADGTHCAIGELLIDVGDIPAEQLTEELPVRLLEELRRRLLERIQTIAVTPAPGEFVRTGPQSRRSRLEQFLETGRLPHEDADGGTAVVERLLLEAVHRDSSGFMAYVRHSPQSDVIIGRLARQFSSAVIAALLDLRAPEAGGYELRVVPDDGGPAEEDLIVLRERLLRRLFSIGGETDVPAMYATDEQTSAPPREHVASAQPTVREEGERYALSRLRGRIEHALVFGDPRSIYPSWARTCLAHSALVRATFMRRMGAETPRRRLAEGFPQSMLLDITALLAPGHDRLIAALLEQPELRTTERTDSSGEELHNAFWFYTLTYLHNAGPDRFKPDEYLRGLAAHLAQNGMAPARISALLRRVTPTAVPAHSDSPAPATKADAICRRLVRRLGGAVSEPPMPQEIAWLVRAHPDQLRQLLRQWQSGDLRLDTGSLDTAEAGILVRFLVDPDHRRNSSGFLSEIEKHAERARDRRLYYLHVLESIAHHRIVDLERAMALSPEAAEETRTSSEIAAQFESQLLRTDPERLRALLDGLRPGEDQLVRAAFLRATSDASARRRMVLVTPAPLLLRLVTVLLPEEGERLRSLVASRHLETDELRLRLWEEILAVLHAEGARRFDYAAFARGIHRAGALSPALRSLAEVAAEYPDAETPETDETRLEFLYRQLRERLAGHHPREVTREMTELAMDYPEVFSHLIAQVYGGEVPIDTDSLTAAELGQLSVLVSTHYDTGRPPPRQTVPDAPGIIPASPREDAPTDSAQAGTITSTHRQRLQALRTRLAEAMVLGRATPVAEHWAECLRHPDMVCSIFRRQMVSEAARCRLAEGFPQSMLQELAALLAPGQERLIASLLEHPALCGEGQGNAPTPRLLTAFWTHTLGYLYDIGRSDFSPTNYLRGLVPHLANDGIENLVRNVAGAADASDGLASPDPDALYRRLIERLTRSGDEPEMAGEIRWLARNHPELLRQLYGQLQSGDTVIAFRHIDGGEAEALVEFFAGQAGEGTGFLTEIQKHAGRARDRRRYFVHILTCLAAQRMVDLEVAIGLPGAESSDAAVGHASGHAGHAGHASGHASARSPDENGREPGRVGELLWNGAANVNPPPHLPPPQPEALYSRLIARLTGAGGEPEMAGEMRWLAANQPELLRRLFRRLQSGDATLHLQRLDREEAKTLAKFFAAQGEDATCLLREIERHSGQALDQRRYFLHLLTSLIADDPLDLEFAARLTGTEPTTGTDHTSAQSPEQTVLRVMLDSVERRLRLSQDTVPVGALVEALARREPALLSRLYGRWRAGEFPGALARLAPDEIKPCVLSFAELTIGDLVPGFRRQVEAYAGLAQDQAAYYRFLLERFITGETIDLERAAAQLADATAAIPAEPVTKPAAPASSHRPTFPPEADARDLPGEEWSEETLIANAGMVLTAPFLPRLFSILDLTGKEGFRNDNSAQRAVHLLQYMVNESSDSPEFLLPLNKLLCGVPLSLPLIRAIEPQPAEKEAISGMLQALIAHWKIIGNTSVQGLRESFLQREGRLRFAADRWTLKVERKGMDVLLEQLPWSFSTVRYSWMPLPIYVEWN